MDAFCELKSDINKFEFHENIENINEWPHVWSAGVITYRLNNHSKDLEERHQKRAVTVALRAWQWRIDKLKFRRERNPDKSVDFDVSFEVSDVFSSKNVLAHAYFPGQGKVSGDVAINDDDWHWRSNIHKSTFGKPPLVSVLMHEFGHSLGLRHDPVQPAMMYPSLDLGKPKYKLSANDVVRIQSRYGKRRISQRIIDRFARRRLFGWDF